MSALASQIRALFDQLAPVYDRGNDLLSVGLARRWRLQAIEQWRASPPHDVLDLACGTGDFAAAAARVFPSCRVTGVDFSEAMIARAQAKYPALVFQPGDAQALSFPDRSFDAVTIGWGFRNFTDRPTALREIARVLKPSGRLLILEAVAPETRFLRFVFFLYRHLAAPLVGLVLCRPRSYAYLMRSMAAMPPSASIHSALAAAGFRSIVCHNICCGMIVRYQATLPPRVPLPGFGGVGRSLAPHS